MKKSSRDYRKKRRESRKYNFPFTCSQFTLDLTSEQDSYIHDYLFSLPICKRIACERSKEFADKLKLTQP